MSATRVIGATVYGSNALAPHARHFLGAQQA